MLAARAGGDDGASVIVRDSAGVTIVENTAPVWRDDPAWSVGAEPVLEIGIADGAFEYQLAGVSDAARFADGRVAVANGGSGEIRIYGADGRWLASLGRPGGGPGEFQVLGGVLVLPGDSVLGFDGAARRLTLFTPAGTLASTIPIEPPLMAPRSDVSQLDDGSLVWVSSGADAEARPVGTVYRPRSQLLRYRRADAVLDTIGTFPGHEVAIARIGDAVVPGVPLLGRRIVHTTHGARVYVGLQERFEIGVYAPDGALRQVIRAPADDLAVTPSLVEDFRRRILERARGEDPMMVPALESYLKAAPAAPGRPAHGSLHVDAAGNLWVAEDNPLPIGGSEPTRYTVFDGQGRMLGPVTLPERFRLFEIGGDYVLGAWQDELDVEYVRVYPLRRAAPDEELQVQ